MNYRINLRTLRAFARRIAPRVDARCYLVGVQIELMPDGIYYVATDGAMLAAIRAPYDASETPPATPLRFIVPREVACELKASTRNSMALLDIEPWSIGGKPFTPVAGAFPDWRRVLPQQDLPTHGERPAQYDGARLARLDACVDDLHDSPACGYFHPNDSSSPGVFVCSQVPDFIGVLMCRRLPRKGSPPAAPEWSGVKTPSGGDWV